ncbi:amino acid permease [Strigomonas culicis]|uniref:Amino acid permease n=1 Tax=Strigomonas culicis TaxID=28005 RepID=S9V5Q8_9TRYP|nr:amino acid permease [Strigomonas culicis]|eukprot:EPY36409.1 amino acid permease [Strigomonas culicis]
MWGNAAFPPFLSFFSVLLTIFVTFIGNASYPSLTSEYAANLQPDMTKGVQAGIKIAVIMICFVLNALGIEIVGSASIILCGITILPFSLLTVIRLFAHGFNKAVLYVDVKSVNWASFFSIISWNYANIENSGAMIEEVADPARSFPIAMVLLMFSTYVAYVMPMLAGVSAMGEGQDYSQWAAGHWPDVAKVIAGDWLRYMLFAGAMLSGIGFTLTSMCTTSRLLAGIGTMEVFPKKVSRVLGYYHPKVGTPIPALALNTAFMIVFSCALDFGDVVSLCQSFYNLRMLVIYGAVLILRLKHPLLPRPYKLPCNNLVCFLCLLPAALFSLMGSVVSAMTSTAIGVAYVCSIVGGLVLSWLYCRLFAPHGFQGTIVTCDMSPDDAVGVCTDDADAPGTLDEGVFFAEGDDVVHDDLLLGILPAPPAEAPIAATEPLAASLPLPRQVTPDTVVFSAEDGPPTSRETPRRPQPRPVSSAKR